MVLCGYVTTLFIYYDNQLIYMARRITVYLSDEQGTRIDDLPHNVSFSELVRNAFDVILEDYTPKKESVIMTTR